MAKSKTYIEAAVAAKLSYRVQSTHSKSEVTLTTGSGSITLTRNEFRKAVEADDRFLATQDDLAAATARAMDDAA